MNHGLAVSHIEAERMLSMHTAVSIYTSQTCAMLHHVVV